ncbi:MAG: hypothetical protein RR058_01710 [Oscillospiraceae bacterium]
MKGVSKKVIEIVDADNEYIERVLVFLKPGTKDVRIRSGSECAKNYVSTLTCEKKKISTAKLFAIIAALTCLAATALYLIFR